MLAIPAALLPALLSVLPDALNVSLPFAYVQSSFITGHNGINCRGAVATRTLNRTERLRRLRVYASNKTSFRGGEMFINTMETTTALLDVREMNSLILQVANETGTPPFYGFWIPSRLPGMWWHSNYTRQPLSYRAKGLMSNGSEWVLFPTQFNPSGTSILNLQGSDLDITNAEAVDLAMTNLGRVMRQDCTPLDSCVGPLVGSYLFSEAALTATYQPFTVHPYRQGVEGFNDQLGNISDLVSSLSKCNN
jgi:hypothetical protein